MSFPAIFLDRDGVLNENRPDYVRTVADLAIFPAAVRALAGLKDSAYKIIVVTNQSVVGRKLITLAQAQAINRHLIREITDGGGRVDDVFMCPHLPAAGCRCRKPRPGMLLDAAAAHDIDLSRSIMIGDALTDLQAGLAAGVPRVALVRTGRGAVQEKLPAAGRIRPFRVFDSVDLALNNLL